MTIPSDTAIERLMAERPGLGRMQAINVLRDRAFVAERIRRRQGVVPALAPLPDGCRAIGDIIGPIMAELEKRIEG